MRRNDTEMPIFGQLQAFVTGRKSVVKMPQRACTDQRASVSEQHSRTYEDNLGANNKVHMSASSDQSATDQASKEIFQRIDDISQVSQAVLVNRVQQLDEQLSKNEKLATDCDKLRQKTHRLREERNDLRQELREAQQQHEELELQSNVVKHRHDLMQSKYKHIVRQVVAPFARAHGLQWDAQNASTMDTVLRPLLSNALEASELRDHVCLLQQEMLAKRDKVQALSDEQLAQDFRNLAALIKTVSRMVRPMQDMNITDFTGSSGLLAGVNQETWSMRSGKKFLIEAWIWSTLCDFVFTHPFGWFGKVGCDLSIMWNGIFGCDHLAGLPTPSPLSEAWRSTTAAQLAQILNPKALAEEFVNIDESFRNLELSVFNHRSHVYGIIMGFLHGISGVEDIPEVHSIVGKAFVFAFQLSLQRARLQVTYPYVGAAFNSSSMRAMDNSNNEDEGDDSEDGVVTFISNPGLTKWGNAHGKDLDQRLDIVTSTVKVEKFGPMGGVSLI